VVAGDDPEDPARAEIAMRQRTPIVYLVDSGGVNLPYQGGVFPGQYGAGRIFYYNSLMRRFLKVPQLAAVMGQCVAGGAYLPALSDVILMVDGTSFMGLGGPNLVEGRHRTGRGRRVAGAAPGCTPRSAASRTTSPRTTRNAWRCCASRWPGSRAPEPSRLAPQRVRPAAAAPGEPTCTELLPGESPHVVRDARDPGLFRGRGRGWTSSSVISPQENDLRACRD